MLPEGVGNGGRPTEIAIFFAVSLSLFDYAHLCFDQIKPTFKKLLEEK